MPKPSPRRWLLGHTSVLVLCAALIGAPAPVAGAVTATLPGDPLTGSGAVHRTELTADQLTDGTATGTVADSAFALPADAAAPAHSFNGTLTLHNLATTGGIAVLKDTPYHYSDNEATRHLPPFSVTLVQDGSHLIPTERGLRYTGNAAWNLAVGPGRAWQENTDGGRTRAALPFALLERNANCVHNGVLTFLFDTTSVTQVRYQVTAETCAYFQFDMWGQADADYRPEAVPNAAALRRDYSAELAARLPVKPISALATDYPDAGVDPSKFGSEITPSAMTSFGLYFNGVNYVGGCRTRQGEYPFCSEMLLPSYSTAKSAFAGTAMLRLAQRYGPSVAQERLSTWIPEAAVGDAWTDTTVGNALDMASGTYDSAGYMIDEDGPTMDAFVDAEAYTDKMRLALTYPRKTDPGHRWVYRTSDTFLAARAMNNYLQSKAGASADLFDMLRDDILVPIGLSPDSRTSLRTDNSPSGVPFGGYGMYWTQNDIARFSKFLTDDHGAVDGTQLLHPGLLDDTLQRNSAERGVTTTGWRPMKYQNGFWAEEFTKADDQAYTSPFFVPFMSGYGGVTVALMPNGATFYQFSDNYEWLWSTAVAEANKLAPMTADGD